jgi:hypothetical protein
MGKRKRHKKRVTQCDCCAVAYCREAQQIECAKGEFVALAAGTVYECPDYVAGYWDQMCA